MAAATVHEFPSQKMEEELAQRQIWKAECMHCRFSAENLQTGNGAEDVARAHSLIHGHDVAMSFSILDCPAGVIRADDPR